MIGNYLWTKSRARLQYRAHHPGANYNWLLVPGGPGLGSESLIGLADILELPGTLWHFDFPGDGSNNTDDDAEYFSHWSQALIEATNALPNVILVAHSSGGMFALATPLLEKNILGLVLLDSAPSCAWQQSFMQYVKANPLADAERLQALFDATPYNELLKKLTIACAPYFSTDASMQKIISILETLPFNSKTHQWAAINFDSTYQAKWVPENIPTLICAGAHDQITPLKLFVDAPEFQRSNIILREIEHSAHFPWLDNPTQVKQLLDEYCKLLPQR